MHRDGPELGVGDVRAAVGRGVPVVAHHPEPAVRHLHRAELGQLGVLLPVEVDVRLVPRLAVHHHPALRVAALDGLPTDRDHPLDEVLLIWLGDADDLTDRTHSALEDVGRTLDVHLRRP